MKLSNTLKLLNIHLQPVLCAYMKKLGFLIKWYVDIFGKQVDGIFGHNGLVSFIEFVLWYPFFGMSWTSLFFKHAFVLYFRRQSRRSSKRIVLPKHVSEPRTAAFASEADCSEKNSQRQEIKLSVTRDKSLKTTHRKKSGKEQRISKVNLVTLRAAQEEEEEEEADDFEPEDEDECFAPEEVNKAPVFVPVGLRSPKPVPVRIEETIEEVSCCWVLHMCFYCDFFNQLLF